MIFQVRGIPKKEKLRPWAFNFKNGTHICQGEQEAIKIVNFQVELTLLEEGYTKWVYNGTWYKIHKTFTSEAWGFN